MACAVDANAHNDVVRDVISNQGHCGCPRGIAPDQWNNGVLRYCLCLTPHTTAAMDMTRMVLLWDAVAKVNLWIKDGGPALRKLKQEPGVKLRTNERDPWKRSADMHVGVADSWNKVEMRLMCRSSSGHTTTDVAMAAAVFIDEAHD